MNVSRDVIVELQRANKDTRIGHVKAQHCCEGWSKTENVVTNVVTV